LAEGEPDGGGEVRTAAVVPHAVDGAGDRPLRLQVGEPVDDVGHRRVLDDADARVGAGDVEEEARGVDEELLDVGPLGRQDAGRVIDQEDQVERSPTVCSVSTRHRSPCTNVAVNPPHRILTRENKKLSYRRVTARCVWSVVILPVATQQCRYYLYDKS